MMIFDIRLMILNILMMIFDFEDVFCSQGRLLLPIPSAADRAKPWSQACFCAVDCCV